jgi:signal transduction histidine kinase
MKWGGNPDEHFTVDGNVGSALRPRTSFALWEQVGDPHVRQKDRTQLHQLRYNGGGIQARHMPHIFERYWTIREGNPNGSGLGLYICRSIVQAHGGELWAQSEPGEGSVFTFSIPALAAPIR